MPFHVLRKLLNLNGVLFSPARLAWLLHLAATPLLWIAPRREMHKPPPPHLRSKTYQNDHDASQDKKIPREELAQFDQFLDKHREISDQLRRDPSLVRNQQFMQSHPELQSYLQDHPQVRQDLFSKGAE